MIYKRNFNSVPNLSIWVFYPGPNWFFKRKTSPVTDSIVTWATMASSQTAYLYRIVLSFSFWKGFLLKGPWTWHWTWRMGWFLRRPDLQLTTFDAFLERYSNLIRELIWKICFCYFGLVIFWRKWVYICPQNWRSLVLTFDLFFFQNF